MNVISKRGLIQLAKMKRIDSDTMDELVAWHQVARHAAWTSLLNIRREFPTADQVGAVIVFNIRHNRYRLITRVEFLKQLIFIKALLNHREYEREDWKKWA
jgi:mRNA interferase HigB